MGKENGQRMEKRKRGVTSLKERHIASGKDEEQGRGLSGRGRSDMKVGDQHTDSNLLRLGDNHP